MKALSSIVVGLALIWLAEAKLDKVICYYESWVSSYPPSDIDVNICTHINYAFFGLTADGNLQNSGGDQVITQLSALKKKKSTLKLLISVGGWNEGSVRFSQVARDQAKRTKFAKSVVDNLKKYNFDGVDIDWEYPAQREGSSPADKKNFVSLLQELRRQLGNRLITIAVSATPDDKSYDVPAISKVVDFINVMTYDYHQGSEGKTGLNAPLYASSADQGWAKENLNCDSSIQNWKKKGASPSKLVLGLAFYGRSFKLTNPNQHGIGAPASGPGSLESAPYSKICATIKNGWTKVFDQQTKVPYAYKGNDWVGYDDPTSIGLKVQYAKKQQLGGVMMWAVDEDDNKGTCGAKNPLLNAIKKNL